MPTPYEQRERELAELDREPGGLKPDIALSYQKRLQEFSNYLDQHMTYTTPEDKAVRRRALNTLNVRQGATNYSSNPDLYTAKGIEITGRGWETDIPAKDRDADAGVSLSVPHRVYVNPRKEYEQKDYPLSNLLGHELAHTKQGIADKRQQLNPTDARNYWAPVFPDSFIDDLARLKKTKYNNPIYSGYGSATDVYEIMGYVMGREVKLRKGKTLKDDPIFKPVFERNPGSWEEYQKSKKQLQNIK